MVARFRGSTIGQSRARDLSSISKDNLRDRKFAFSLVIWREKSGVLTCRLIGFGEYTAGHVDGRFDSVAGNLDCLPKSITDFLVFGGADSKGLKSNEWCMYLVRSTGFLAK